MKYKSKLESDILPGDLVCLKTKYITFDNRIVDDREYGLVLGYADAWIAGYGTLCLVWWQASKNIARVYECDLKKIQ